MGAASSSTGRLGRACRRPSRAPGLVGANPYQVLSTLGYPFGLPFSLPSEQLRKYLHYLQVTPEELYRLFTPRVNHDVVAREYLGLTAKDVEIMTTVLTKLDLKKCYGLTESESLADLHNVARFSAVTALTEEQLSELLHAGPEVEQFDKLPLISRRVATDPNGTTLQWTDNAKDAPFAWFELVNRFLRLARRTGMAITDLAWC